MISCLCVYICLYMYIHIHVHEATISIKKNCWNFDRDCVESIDQFEGNCHLKNIESSNTYNDCYFIFILSMFV